MKKIFIITITVILMIIFAFFTNQINASNETVINNKTESKLVEIKEKETNSMEYYEKVYGSKSYGMTAYILHKVQIYSIPFCILGILAGAVYEYIIGLRHLETLEKGQALMISFITIGIICQVLPLVFTIAVKFGRE